MSAYYVYILVSWTNDVMYIGVTNNLERRIYEHKHKLLKGFSAQYNVDKLVYFEDTSDINAAIVREKQLKKWRREKKNALVIKTNPTWKDLSEDWYNKDPSTSGKPFAQDDTLLCN